MTTTYDYNRTLLERESPDAAPVAGAFRTRIEQVTAAMAAMAPVVAAFARDLGKLASALQPVTKARREGISAMHAEYARRQRARRRRR